VPKGFKCVVQTSSLYGVAPPYTTRGDEIQTGSSNRRHQMHVGH